MRIQYWHLLLHCGFDQCLKKLIYFTKAIQIYHLVFLSSSLSSSLCLFLFLCLSVCLCVFVSVCLSLFSYTFRKFHSLEFIPCSSMALNATSLLTYQNYLRTQAFSSPLPQSLPPNSKLSCSLMEKDPFPSSQKQNIKCKSLKAN